MISRGALAIIPCLAALVGFPSIGSAIKTNGPVGQVEVTARGVRLQPEKAGESLFIQRRSNGRIYVFSGAKNGRGKLTPVPKHTALGERFTVSANIAPIQRIRRAPVIAVEHHNAVEGTGARIGGTQVRFSPKGQRVTVTSTSAAGQQAIMRFAITSKGVKLLP